MFLRNAKEAVDDARRALSAAHTPGEIAEALLAQLSQLFESAVLRIVLRSDGETIDRSSAATSDSAARVGPRFEGEHAKLGSTVLNFPVFVSDPRRSRMEPELARYLERLSAHSYSAVALYGDGRLIGWIECWYSEEHHSWSREDSFLLQQLAQCAALSISGHLQSPVAFDASEPELRAEIDDLREQYERILEYGNLIVVRTNPDFELIDVRGDTMSVLGVSSETLLNDRTVWSRFLHSPDFRVLSRKVRGSNGKPTELNEEIRVINQETSQVRWLLLRGIPLFSAQDEFLGWEGFGLDITDRHSAQEELVEQGKRVEALYEVARALQVNLDPALVTLRGLRALLTATGSDCGFTCFYDSDQDVLELVSSEGLSPSYVEEVSKLLNGPTLVRLAVDQKEGLLINNIQQDSRAAVDIARREGLRSTIIMPLMMKEEVQGALVLFCRKANRYSDADFDLVSAAASQICLAVRQAESYLSEKRQVSALGVMYRLSHELSKHTTPREIAEHAFPIIQSELSCKRMWLGVLNEQGTLLLGQAGTGPGVRRHLIDVQIELDEQNDLLDQALKKKQPVVVRPTQHAECARLSRFAGRLNLDLFVIVPLIALGQTVGVLIVEPTLPSAFMVQRKLSLLASMASEIATIILARRFEAKMADAEKMRMAGLLASGVAHNFNNMLQAVMGQASLIEMQLQKDSPLVGSARLIVEAASKGASLIKQLLSFAMPAAESRSLVSINHMIGESNELYRSVLGSSIALEVRLDEDAPQVRADYGKLQQVITNLLMNAKEAIAERTDGVVRISSQRVRVASGDVSPDLAPGDYLRIDISDNGAGMDAERQSRCFEPFFTTKNVDSRTGLGFTGSGLGLSSAYSIVKGHDGSITVSSTVGEGSVFSIYLPVSDSNEKEPSANARLERTVGEVQHALLVGESAQKNFTLISSIESLGVRVIPVADPAAVAGMLQKDGKTVQFVVVEDRENTEAIARLIEDARKIQPELRVLVLSSRAQETAALLGALQEVVIVSEPVSLWSIQAALKRLVFGRQAVTGLPRSIEIETTSGPGPNPRPSRPSGFRDRETL